MCAHHAGSHDLPVTTDDRTSNSTGGTSAAGHRGIPHYEIRVKGHLASRWAAWFDGLNLTTEDGGTTVLRGPVADQAALHGLLQKLRDLGIPLVSLVELPIGAPDAPPAPQTPKGN
jgi:hypothetical protein